MVRALPRTINATSLLNGRCSIGTKRLAAVYFRFTISRQPLWYAQTLCPELTCGAGKCRYLGNCHRSSLDDVGSAAVAAPVGSPRLHPLSY